jgi:polysaccharide biosynthesis protein PslG
MRQLSVSRLGQALCIVVLAVSISQDPVRAGNADTSSSGAHANDTRDDSSPWGVASGAEWFSAFPVFNPKLKQAGVRWLRGFYEWQALEPKHGYWNFALSDRLVENTRANGLHLTGVFAYFAPWASADGGTRKFPIKDIQYWRDYVSAMVTRYHADIKYWEVWNEFNGSFAENGTPELYAELVREAASVAKAIDPTVKIGMSVANFDVGFLDAAIKAGAAGHFDFVCVHPYEKLGALANGGELGFLGMTSTLRQMLAANRQPSDMPLWITEIGSEAPVTRNDPADQMQANLLAKAYLLSIASGFQRTFWFEARGPSYGKNSDLGLIRSDMSPRPSYEALKALTTTLGKAPKSAGWLNLDGGYGFMFDANGKYVLAAWAGQNSNIDVGFAGDVRVSDLKSAPRVLTKGTKLHLSDFPQLITSVPASLVHQAQSNLSKPYPWGGNVAHSKVVTSRLRVANVENGVRQVNIDTTLPGEEWRRTDISRADAEGHYVYFLVDSQFVPYGSRNLRITAVVRRVAADKLAGLSLNYESQKGYVNSTYINIPEDENWHELSWTVADANFVGAWGWNFRLNGISSPSDFLVKEVRVENVQQP